MSDKSELDDFGCPYHIPAKWSRHLDGDDDGFPVLAFTQFTREFDAICTLGSILKEFNRDTYDSFLRWYQVRRSEQGLTSVSSKWINISVIDEYVSRVAFTYTDSKTGEVQESVCHLPYDFPLQKHTY